MVELITILLISLSISLAGLAGGLLLLWKESFTKHISIHLVSFAAGALLGAVFLDILPEALSMGALNETFFIYMLGGIVLFYILERFLFLYHCHGGKCDVHTYGYLAIFGDTLHNFADGILIAGSFLISFPLGIVTALAVFFHEIPQEVGDFSIMLHSGFKQGKIILYNLISALAAVFGVVVGYYFSTTVAGLTSIILALIAGNFIYIAGVDLIPETTKDKEHMRSAKNLLLFFGGIATMYAVGVVL